LIPLYSGSQQLLTDGCTSTTTVTTTTVTTTTATSATATLWDVGVWSSNMNGKFT